MDFVDVYSWYMLWVLWAKTREKKRKKLAIKKNRTELKTFYFSLYTWMRSSVVILGTYQLDNWRDVELERE
jgi:hypothetical protein